MSEDIFTKEAIKNNLKSIEGWRVGGSMVPWFVIATAVIQAIVYLADKIGGKSE